MEKKKEEGVQKGKIPPCRIGYLISVSNRDTNKSRVPNTFWTPSHIGNIPDCMLRLPRFEGTGNAYSTTKMIYLIYQYHLYLLGFSKEY